MPSCPVGLRRFSGKQSVNFLAPTYDPQLFCALNFSRGALELHWKFADSRDTRLSDKQKTDKHTHKVPYTLDVVHVKTIQFDSAPRVYVESCKNCNSIVVGCHRVLLIDPYVTCLRNRFGIRTRWVSTNISAVSCTLQLKTSETNQLSCLCLREMRSFGPDDCWST